MIQSIKIQVDGANFGCDILNGRVVVFREHLYFGIWDKEIKIGYSYNEEYDLELKNNLELYRKTLAKVKGLLALI